MNILLTSGRTPVPLDLARTLKAQGHKVFLVESLSFHLCSLSTAFEKQFRVEPPASQTSQYIKSLKKIIRECEIEVIIPLYEEIFYLAIHKSELEQYCRLLSDDIETLDRFHNKNKFVATIKKLGLPTPETIQVTSKADALAKIQTNASVVMKPTYSRFGKDVLHHPKPSDLDILDIGATRPWVVQQRITGQQYCVYALADQGNVKALAIYPQEMVAINMCVNFVHEPHPGISQWVELVVKDCHFSGQISFDLILDDQNRIYPIEANPRVTSGIHLLVNEPEFNHQLLHPESKPVIQPKSDSQAMLAFLVILRLLVCGKDFRRNWQRFRQSRDAVYSSHDPLPAFIGQFLFGVYLIIKGMINGKNFYEISSLDIDWNGK